MSALAIVEHVSHLPSLIDRASRALAGAKSAAEVLEARDVAGFAYDAAKRAGRLAKAKQAHDDVIAAAFRAQADALEIEAGAKRRLADEYDAAQERGEVAKVGQYDRANVPDKNVSPPSAADIGLTRKDVFEARQVRDAEVNEPGIVRRALDSMLDQREEPTKAALRAAVLEAAERGLRPEPKPSNRNPLYRPPSAEAEAWTYLYGTCRDLRDWASGPILASALDGMAEREDDQAANIRAVRDAAAVLNGFLERLHVE